MNVFFECKNVGVIASHGSGEAIYNVFCRRFLSSLVWILSSVYFVACDFHGPWEYYPEEREVYTGIYTYGYILESGETKICFSKVYELDEASSQDFSFYDSAYVTVSGLFNYNRKENRDTTIELYHHGSNCFSQSSYEGIAGESYTMNAYFVWDSAGQTVASTYKAVATVPNRIKVNGMSAPQQDGSYKWIENPWNDASRRFYPIDDFTIDFLEYPMDMQFIKVALDYDNSVRGVLSIMNYDINNGESQNTTMNQMFKGVTDADETGYRGISMHDPLEKQQNLGFSSNRTIAGVKNLDTLYLMNMMLPLGRITVDFYSTDDAYVDYVDKVKQSVQDSRVIPESNVENGMGVFSGMAKTQISIMVNGDGVGFYHIANRNCANEKGDNTESWDSRGCRLYQDVICSGGVSELMLDGWLETDLIDANERAAEIYRDSVYNRGEKGCYASNVKAAMTLDTTKWSLFLPDTINAEDKANAYADGLKRYCVASNFESNHIADCSGLEKECMEDPERNNCKEYLWLWCADRGWDFYRYDQCRSAFVSRYYLQNLKSSVLHREVEYECRYWLNYGDDVVFRNRMCGNWCKVEDNQVKCQ